MRRRTADQSEHAAVNAIASGLGRLARHALRPGRERLPDRFGLVRRPMARDRRPVARPRGILTESAVLALLAALDYGTSDFAAGLASRRFAAGAVTGAEQAIGLLIAAAAVILAPHGGPGAGELGWGALSGLGAAVGLLALFHGLSIAPFSSAWWPRSPRSGRGHPRACRA